MEKCGCFSTRERLIYSAFCEPYCETIGICCGTKECEECSCGGDRTKCNFYPKVREEAKRLKAIEDAITHFKYGISHDIFSEPVTTYAKLAVKALEEQISKR